MRWILTAGLVLGLAFMGAARAQAPRTVSDYFLSLDASAGRLDGQMAERQRAGDMAAAQRLALVAAMVRRAAAEFRGAEQIALLEPVASLPAPIPQRADATLALAAEAERRAGAQADFTPVAHATVNALLAALPQKTAHPVFYGLLSGDLAPLKADVVIYGFRLVDPLSKTLPTVLQGKTELAASQIAVGDDFIEVKLPDSVKAAVRFDPPPCEPRPSFALRVRTTYRQPHGIWPITWTSEIQTAADLYALPSPVTYSASISGSAETVSATVQTVNFRRKSSLAVADCGETNTVQALAPLPDNAREATCTASWTDASGAARLAARCAIGPQGAEATGEIAASPRVCSPENPQLCTCLNQAHGFLEASGSYRVEQPAHQLRPLADQPPISFPAGGTGRGRIDLGPGERLRHIALTISRRACPTPLDRLDLSPTDAADAEASAVSRSGNFRAILRGSELSVGATEALRGP